MATGDKYLYQLIQPQAVKHSHRLLNTQDAISEQSTPLYLLM